MMTTAQSRTISTTSSLADDEAGGSESNFSTKDDEELTVARLHETICSIQQETRFLCHQIISLTKLFNNSGCVCDPCVKIQEQIHQTDGSAICTSVFPKPVIKNDAEIIATETLPAALPSPVIENKQPDCSTPSAVNYLDTIFNSSIADYEREGKRGRKSKYCNAEMKVAVVSYAKKHGPTAAARKFNIPPAVASYYYRKSASKSSEFYGTSSTPIINSSNTPGNEDSLTQNVNSPSFFRGRTRGRPKLIGDELDAALVDHMVQIKRQNPDRPLTANAALEHSRKFIRENQPGLLFEEGGPITLKHTWAMKLLARVTEKENGLSNPATTQWDNDLSDVSDSAGNVNVANLVNQLIGSLGGHLPSGETNSNVIKDNAENEMSEASSAPEIDSEIEQDPLKAFFANLTSDAC